MPKKLIEVALPLEAISDACGKEKNPFLKGHPRNLHLWWARRPLAAARAVIWASMVDDPSEHPEMFPTEEAQFKERERLFKILSELIVWENSNNEMVLDEAKAEIMKYTHGNPPALLDPFAGGGAIPLEAQRLGLEAHANDLNPVAVMINKAMIEITPRFAGMPPVNPNDNLMPQAGWEGANGLSRDVEYYGQWIKKEAIKRIGYLYPKVKLPQEKGGGEAIVEAWIWTRTVKCPNPTCGCEIPLARSFTLSKKKGHEAWIEPRLLNGKTAFIIHEGENKNNNGTVNRKGAVCPYCRLPIEFSYIRAEGKEKRMGSLLMAIVAKGKSGHIYLNADDEQKGASQLLKPEDFPDALIPNNPRDFKTPNYGMSNFSDLFTNRQLVALTTYSDLILEAQKVVKEDAIKAGMSKDSVSLEKGGKGADAYSDAICIYLAFAIDQLARYSCTLCSWNITNQNVAQAFGRQALPMVWDFAEANVLEGPLDFSTAVSWPYVSLKNLPSSGIAGIAMQIDAQSDCGLRDVVVSTDPPYYDNIGYADLSDFFYIWMRKTLKDIYPSLFQTMLTPKSEELIATPYRHNGSKDEAKNFFEKGMLSTCKKFYMYACDDVPVTIYYAYKQSETDLAELKTSSSGWETMLSAIIQSGFTITGTWPIRTERTQGLKGEMNTLASSIVLVCRKRDKNARNCTRRDFITALKRELKPALEKLQLSNIAPVDLAQSAIGPGMAVFSRYQKVLEADGTPMSVRSALQIINQELDLYFNGQDSSIDNDSRFCVELFSQCAYNPIKFGDADILARAKGTSVAQVAGKGVIYAAKGEVHLLERDDLPEKVNQNEHNVWLLTQQLTRAMENGGIQECAKIVAPMLGIQVEEAKNLAYRLYSICERKNWAQEAYAYNALVVAWPEIQSKAAEIKSIEPTQLTLDDLGLKTD